MTSQVEPLINKGDICTFNTNNEEEKKTIQRGEMIKLNILKQTSINEHIIVQNSV